MSIAAKVPEMAHNYFLKKLVTKNFFVLTVISLAVSAQAIPLSAYQFQSKKEFTVANQIDTLVMDIFKAKSIKPATLCSDEVFIRRAYLDVTGTLPTAYEVRKFLKNPRKTKRASLINALLAKPEYADYWSLKWCDLLRVKAEFPINLWPNAVQAYHRWIRDSLAENMPYDQFVRQMLTSSGSNFRVPEVNFYRAIQGQEPSSIATAVGLTFMGTRLGQWPEQKRKNFNAFFSRVGYKSTAEWKEEIVYLNPEPLENSKLTFPDGTTVTIKPGQDPRIVFADWLIKPENKWFAKNITNRIWAWMFGTGLIHEPDDIRTDNPAVHPKVLTYLQTELVKSNYDLKHIYKLILNSSTYQQSSIPKADPANAKKYFACYPVRQLDAEVLIDALCGISGTKESYSSPIPEPFTFIPEEHRSINLADGSITSQFLEMFGRPPRDTGLESERNSNPTEAQRRYLLNSTHIQKKIERSQRLKNLIRAAKNKRPEIIRIAYLNILSRFPTEKEMATAEAYFKQPGTKLYLATNDLLWALINSKEFLYRH